MPKSSREKSEETRVRLVEAAHGLFMEKGYHATSMRDVSQRAALSVGAIYNHFATKEDLWKEVILVKHPYHEILPLLLSGEGETIADVVRSAADALVHVLLKREDLLNLMFIEIVEFNARHIPELVQQILPEAAGLGRVFAGKGGRLRDQIPPAVLLRSFLGLFFSYYITGILLRTPGNAPVDQPSLDQFVALYLYGILAEDDPSRIRPT